MSVSDQAAWPESALGRFLDARLPQREVVAQAWALRIVGAPWLGIEIDHDHRKQLGSAIEIRIGLDLARIPGYWDVLSFLPPEECRTLLSEVGYSSEEDEHIADTGTVDPLLREWNRSFHPAGYDDHQRAVLNACWDAAGMRDLAHGFDYSAELRRSVLVHRREDFGDRPRPEAAITGLVHLWEGYLRHGRTHLMALGDRIILEPELVSGFGKPDLVAGRCLIDIKAALDPARYLGSWLNQLLGYVLLDWHDVFWLDAVALYLGWQALLVHEPLTGLLAASTPGPTPTVADLRAEFRAQIQADVDNEFTARMCTRYPPPLAP